LSWFLQPLSYCHLYGYTKFVICWFEMFTDEIKWHIFDFDKELFENITKQVGDFWNNYMLTDTPPPAVSEEDIKKLFPDHKEGKSVNATEEQLLIYSDAIVAKRNLSVAKKEYDGLTLKIKLMMQDSEYLLSPMDDTLATFRNGNNPNKKYDEVILRIKSIMGDAEYLSANMDDTLAPFKKSARGRTLRLKEL